MRPSADTQLALRIGVLNSLAETPLCSALSSSNPRGVPYELGRLFSDTAGTTSETSINAVLSVMPNTNLLYGIDFGAAR